MHHTSYCEGTVLSLDIFGHFSIILVFSLFNIGILVQLGQAVHLCQVVEESPNVRRHRRSHRDVRTNWVETKFVGHVFNAHQFSLRARVAVTSLHSSGLARLLPLHSVHGEVEVVVAVSIGGVVQDPQSKTHSTALPSTPFVLSRSWCTSLVLEIFLGLLPPAARLLLPPAGTPSRVRVTSSMTVEAAVSLHPQGLLFSVLRSEVNCLLSPKTAVEVACLRLVARSVVVVTWAVVVLGVVIVPLLGRAQGHNKAKTEAGADHCLCFDFLSLCWMFLLIQAVGSLVL